MHGLVYVFLLSNHQVSCAIVTSRRDERDSRSPRREAAAAPPVQATNDAPAQATSTEAPPREAPPAAASLPSAAPEAGN